ncbi:Ribosomal RNA-processing protein 8, related [Eimeria praecox]|uniref:Ribosomal RNA-processing protein 8 n=1 Tax=Eimeria praecox TaxID=51316 RepID=U6GEB8_9EIME|nr:Ribosomal RNA-processing protein 8, related [Eimeria praecox]
MLSLRYKSRRVDSREAPHLGLRKGGHFLGVGQQRRDLNLDRTSGGQVNETRKTTSGPDKKIRHQQQERQQQQQQQGGASESAHTSDSIHRAAQHSSAGSPHGNSGEFGVFGPRKNKKRRKQKEHLTGEEAGDGGRCQERKHLNSDKKRNLTQRAAQLNNSELPPSSKEKKAKVSKCEHEQTQHHQQQERQLLLVKQFSQRGAAASSASVPCGLPGTSAPLAAESIGPRCRVAVKETEGMDVSCFPLFLPFCIVCRVGDFGCGEAALALRFPERTFYSFDLVAANERITACDISSVPLPDASLDVAVFCLSLMGEDWPVFLKEARRVLRSSGNLIIAEVSSRIASLPAFVAAVESLGFRNVKQKDLASFFVLLVFKVEKKQPKVELKQLSPRLLQPCLYKRR